VTGRDDAGGHVAGDATEPGDPLGLGAVVGDDQRDAAPRGGEPRHQRRAAFVGVDEVRANRADERSQPRCGGEGAVQATGQRPALVGDAEEVHVGETRVGPGLEPFAGRSGGEHVVPACAQRGGQVEDVTLDPPRSEVGAHLDEAHRHAHVSRPHARAGLRPTQRTTGTSPSQRRTPTAS
jgi:hypothetical protein